MGSARESGKQTRARVWLGSVENTSIWSKAGKEPFPHSRGSAGIFSVRPDRKKVHKYRPDTSEASSWQEAAGFLCGQRTLVPRTELGVTAW